VDRVQPSTLAVRDHQVAILVREYKPRSNRIFATRLKCINAILLKAAVAPARRALTFHSLLAHSRCSACSGYSGQHCIKSTSSTLYRGVGLACLHFASSPFTDQVLALRRSVGCLKRSSSQALRLRGCTTCLSEA